MTKLYVGFAAADMIVDQTAVKTEEMETGAALELISGGYQSRCFKRSLEEVERFKSAFGVELQLVRHRSKFMKTGDRFLEIVPKGESFAFKLYSL